MMIFKKAIPRRAFLRGMGTTLALPLLDGMVPALAGAVGTAAKPAVRLSVVYVPNGIIMDKWTPAAEGTAFDLPPILEPLAPFRDRLLVLSGLAQNEGRARPGEAGGDHSCGCATFLTGVRPKQTEGADLHVGISADQIAAKELGKHTQLASLELGLDPNEVVGICESGFSCAYSNTLSWRTPTTPLPVENNPRAVFERLFGDSDSTDPAERLTRGREDRSLLDSAIRDAARLLAMLGPNDRAKLTEYLDAIRDVERRIQMAEEQASQELPMLDRPVGIPATFEEHVKLLFDLQVLAYQCDMTRVITFYMGREQSTRTYPEIGIADPHHPLTHHSGDAVKIAKVIQINSYHTKMFAYFLEKLRSTPDGDGSLLDHLMIVYGGGLSDGNLHLHNNLPILLVGGGGQIKGGRHLRYPKDTPMMNLHLAMLDKMGIPEERLGDSTGKLELLSGV
ncbi:MAG: DUF1552 domain-containing protein [Acidobacteria bacterium]|nr:DUF1552 domain-containing protein [Acidobacteriota bacterium]